MHALTFALVVASAGLAHAAESPDLAAIHEPAASEPAPRDSSAISGARETFERAILERDQGNLTKSMDLMRHACEVSSRSAGENAFETSLYQANLAFILIQLEDDAGGAQLLKQCVPAFRLRYGATHENTLRLRTSLANALANSGDTVATLAQLDTVDAGCRSRAGPPSPEEHFAGTTRASLLTGRGKRLEARALLLALLAREDD